MLTFVNAAAVAGRDAFRIRRWVRDELIEPTGLSPLAPSHHDLYSAAFITSIVESDLRHTQP
jgi:hypothetical protein